MKWFQFNCGARRNKVENKPASVNWISKWTTFCWSKTWEPRPGVIYYWMMPLLPTQTCNNVLDFQLVSYIFYIAFSCFLYLTPLPFRSPPRCTFLISILLFFIITVGYFLLAVNLFLHGFFVRTNLFQRSIVFVSSVLWLRCPIILVYIAATSRF